MMPSLGFLIAGVCMLVVRFLSSSSFLDFHSAWAAYDVAAISITAVGVISLALRLVLIFVVKR